MCVGSVLYAHRCFSRRPVVQPPPPICTLRRTRPAIQKCFRRAMFHPPNARVHCACAARALRVHCACAARALRVRCVCAACALRVRCVCAACALRVRCVCAACALRVQCLCNNARASHVLPRALTNLTYPHPLPPPHAYRVVCVAGCSPFWATSLVLVSLGRTFRERKLQAEQVHVLGL